MGTIPLEVVKIEGGQALNRLFAFLEALKYPPSFIRRAKRIQIEYTPATGIASVIIVPGPPLTPTSPKSDPLSGA